MSIVSIQSVQGLMSTNHHASVSAYVHVHVLATSLHAARSTYLFRSLILITGPYNKHLGVAKAY